MAYQLDSISLRGLRKAHLKQLVAYIRGHRKEGWFYGNRAQFQRRHQDLLRFAERLEALAGNPDVKMPPK